MSKLVLTIKHNTWWIEVPIIPAASTLKHALVAPRWLCSLNPPRFVPVRREDHSAVRVRYRSHKVQVAISHDGPAYIGEEFPIDINITNEDDRELEVVLDVLLQPTEIDEAGAFMPGADRARCVLIMYLTVNYIAMDDQRSTSLLKAISCGVLAPGVSVLKKLHLTNAGAPGERVVDISVQSHSTAQPPVSPVSPVSPSAPQLVDRSETLRTLAVAAVRPLEVEYTVEYRRPTRPQPGISDLTTFDGGKRDETAAVEAVVTSTIVVVAPVGLVIQGVVLHRKVSVVRVDSRCTLAEAM